MPGQLDLSRVPEHIARILAEEEQRPRFELQLPQTPPYDTLNPELLAWLGGIGDAASTYTSLKRGGIELNPLFSFTKNQPEATGGAVLGSALLSKLGRHFIRKKFPKIADALAANEGAKGIGLAIGNFLETPNSFEFYRDTLQRSRK